MHTAARPAVRGSCATRRAPSSSAWPSAPGGGAARRTTRTPPDSWSMRTPGMPVQSSTSMVPVPGASARRAGSASMGAPVPGSRKGWARKEPCAHAAYVPSGDVNTDAAVVPAGRWAWYSDSPAASTMMSVRSGPPDVTAVMERAGSPVSLETVQARGGAGGRTSAERGAMTVPVSGSSKGRTSKDPGVDAARRPSSSTKTLTAPSDLEGGRGSRQV
mmetsp:Transcript_14701/g.43136  ORF Transcript_14701/g.43136 Transcript_14701/m.43136 type:complete len:217 (-) Transcript_14701:384-1034(-)